MKQQLHKQRHRKHQTKAKIGNLKIHIRYFCWNKVTKIRSPGAGFRILKQKNMDSLPGAEKKTLPEHKVIQGLAQTGATLYQAKYRT